MGPYRLLYFKELSGEGNPLDISIPSSLIIRSEAVNATTVRIYFSDPVNTRASSNGYITLTTNSGKSQEVHYSFLLSVHPAIFAINSPSNNSSVLIYDTSITDVTAITWTPGS
tara:strand:+ start:17277 stop:17615 length:339 start_codon:yes stop_codon:yes gene_type:complete